MISIFFCRVGAPPVLFLLILVGSLDFTCPLIFLFSLILATDIWIPNTLLWTAVLVWQDRLSIFWHKNVTAVCMSCLVYLHSYNNLAAIWWYNWTFTSGNFFAWGLVLNKCLGHDIHVWWQFHELASLLLVFFVVIGARVFYSCA